VPASAGVSELLKDLAGVVPAWCDGWYLFGAQAVQVWGLPRLSADVDVTVRLRGADSHGFMSAMREAGFDLRIADVDDFVRRTRVLPFVHRKSRIPLDVVLAGPGPEEEFLARARTVSIEGVDVPVISPEDLIVTKVLAGRPKDIEDIRGILARRGKELELGRIRALLAVLEEALGQSDLRPLFEAQLSAVRRTL
jgi:Nucleotidyl transferase of unknown function (DUF2204)